MFMIALILTALGGTHAQLTAQTRVAPDLTECYTNATLLDRKNLPPATISVLIDIIRKIEDSPNVNVDLRQLAVLLLHTYRQDGIQYHQPETVTSANVLPYSPTFHSFHRHRLLLTRLVPGNMQVLSNDTIPSIFKCALHHMLSTTVDARARGDESTCNQLSQYRALRTARHARRPRRRRARSVDDDVEILDPELMKGANQNGQMRQYNPKDDVEYNGYGNAAYERQLDIGGESQCPLLGGVVKTSWGSVSAGNLIAGIAAGTQSQQVSVTDLTKGSVLNYQNVQQYVTAIYPATLSGDLAEAVLIQGTERGSTTISIGAAGGWNSTQAPRYYMIQSRTNIEMTDPEIRGDIDGFVLGISSDSFNSLKLSQVLDMYYSPRNGVLNPNLRACNRRALIQSSITDTTLASETYAFAAVLDSNMPLRGTITGGLDALVTSAITNFQSYATSNLNDLTCITTESTSRDYRLKTNLYIVLDSTWPYQAVYPAISYLVDVIDVNKFGSSITLLSAFDGSIVVNKTFSVADFHSAYTLSKHQSMFTGVNLQTAITNIREMMHNELEHEKVRNYVGGNSSVLLFLLNTGNLQNNDMVWEQARILNETVPDLRILFATSTNHYDSLWNLVRNVHEDIMTVSLTSTGTNVEIAMEKVVERIALTGRRVVNPLCGSQFVDASSGSRQFEDYVEPGYTNFYAISPNYFYANNDNRKIRITRSSGGVGSLIICHSRSVEQPRQNSTSADASETTCQTLQSGTMEVSLQNACSSAWSINTCQWFYFSVQSNTAGASATSTVCNEAACRFPYNIRFQVGIDEFGCYSSASGIGSSVAAILLALLVTSFARL